jgi:arylsulfatase A-like enzyme
METVIKNDKVIEKMAPIRMLGTLASHASEFIADASKKDQPFFLYLALNSPHSPVVPSEKWQGKSGMGAYADFVMETDDVVGQVMAALENSGIADNTLLFVTSDNGCSYPVANGKQLEIKYNHFASAQFRGSKSDIWEGGHRIPFFVRWPGKVEANTKNNTLICLTSLMATCAEIINFNIPENAGEDSRSILPLLLSHNEKFKLQPIVHHSIQGKFSIRDGKWKLVFCPGSGGWTDLTDAKARKQGLPELQLYDIQLDQYEQNNLCKEHPEIVSRLHAELIELVENGRSTPGELQKNDVPVDILKEKK